MWGLGFRNAHKTILLILVGVTCMEASPHHDDLLRPNLNMLQLHEHHIFRLKGMIFGLLGITSVFVVAYLLYEYIIRQLRTRRNQTDATFSERGLLLPISEFDERTHFVQPVFAPFKSVRNYMRNMWATPTSAPIPRNTPYRPKYENDPWEGL